MGAEAAGKQLGPEQTSWVDGAVRELEGVRRAWRGERRMEPQG